MKWFFLALLAGFAAVSAHAVQPDEMLRDPALEARARAISRDLRCLVCQNQSIDDSDAELARDLRLLLRRRLTAGDTDEQAKQFLVDRYGDYVLLKPPFKTATLALWLGPGLLLALGGLTCLVYFRRRAVSGGVPEPLSRDERRRVAALMGDEETP